MAWATLIALSVLVRQLPASAADMMVSTSHANKARSTSVQSVMTETTDKLETANLPTESLKPEGFEETDLVDSDGSTGVESLLEDSAVSQELEDTSSKVKPITDQPEEWIILRDNQEPVQLRVVSTPEGHASLIVNDAEVVRIRSELDDQMPRERVIKVAETLYAQLSLGNPAEAIKESTSDDANFIRFGDITLLTVDNATAARAGLAGTDLTHVWTKQLRKALGVVDVVKADVIIKTEKAAKQALKKTGRFLTNGVASWYGPGFHGRTAANGSRYNMYAMTAAHKTLPFGSRVKVINRSNGKSVIVKITDRGPYAHGRVIDLSKAAAQSIGMLGSGTANVALELI